MPTEVLENSAPLIQRERSLRTDSGGAGQWRGGLGQTSVMTLREREEWRVSALADRTTVPAPGADGGHDGAPGEVSVDGEPLPTKRLTRLEPDARVRLDLPGGGGVGDPRERDPQAVLRDVVDGYVSIEAAQRALRRHIRQNRQGRVLLPEDFEIVRSKHEQTGREGRRHHRVGAQHRPRDRGPLRPGGREGRRLRHRGENADRVVEEIKAAGGEAVADYTDVSQPEQVDALVAHAVEAFGGLHVMVNNAGMVRDAVKHVFDADIAFFDRVIAANLRGHYLC